MPSSAQASAPSSHRVFGLDLLRAIAILVVVLGHSAPLLPPSWQAHLIWFALPGVTIFFVLSGYLIGGILIHTLEAGRIDGRALRHFWARRWLRTLPAYFVTLLLLLGLNKLWTPGFQLAHYQQYLWFGQNLFYPQSKVFFAESWSLAVEEWFYLLAPLCLWGLMRLGRCSVRQALLITAVFFTLIAFLTRLHHWLAGYAQTISEWDVNIRKQVFTRFDSLMLGIIAAYLAHYHPRIWRWAPRWCLALGILLFYAQIGLLYTLSPAAIISRAPLYAVLGHLFLASLATMLCLPFLSQWKLAWGRLAKVITFISLISYSWYLIHYSIFSHWILPHLPLPGKATDLTFILLRYVLYWLGSLGMAYLSYRWVEQAGMRLREKLFPQSKAKGAVNRARSSSESSA